MGKAVMSQGLAFKPLKMVLKKLKTKSRQDNKPVKVKPNKGAAPSKLTVSISAWPYKQVSGFKNVR
jgi:hypothetical protein